MPLSRAMMKKRLRWLGHVVRMKDDRLPKIALFGQSSRAKRKVGCPRLGWEAVIKKDFKGNGSFEASNRLGWWRSVGSCVGFRWLGTAVSF